MKLVPENIKSVCLERCSNVSVLMQVENMFFFYQRKPVLKDVRKDKGMCLLISMKM